MPAGTINHYKKGIAVFLSMQFKERYYSIIKYAYLGNYKYYCTKKPTLNEWIIVV